jgi:hypothetical protein
MLQPFDSELGDFVEEICADLCRFECAATAGCEPAQVSVEREVALGTTLSPTSGSRRQRARALLAPQRTAVVQGARGFAQSRLVLDLASGEVERVTLTLRRGAGLPMQAP